MMKSLLGGAILAASFGLLAHSALAQCESSKWGPGDQVGNANLITPESVKAATALVKQGKTHHLGIVIGRDTPAFPPRSLSVTVLQPGFQWGNSPFPNGMVYNDDIFMGWIGIGSQLDGLGHIGHEGQFYNCNDGKDFAKPTGLEKLGIETVPPLVARGIVLDMAAHAGVQNLAAGQVFTVEDVMAVEQKQGTPIRAGDVVLFHTGWTTHVLPADPAAWGAGEPGIAEEVATYMVEKQVIAVGADTWGLDPIPPHKEGRPFQGHITLIKENGIYILETMDTGPLVEAGAYEFMFVLGPARLKGAVQALVDPIALY
jgi:kynurenine formamidase